MRSGLAALLPADVEVEVTTRDLEPDSLLPEERDTISRAVTSRQAEFATGRTNARRALARLGYPPSPLLRGPSREPLWPPGVVGSLTHCPGYCAAAVAQVTDLWALGVDAELHQPLPAGVTDLVTVDGEAHHLVRLAAAEPTISWDRVLFSAKESIYKAWFPLARRWLDFTECELTIDAAGSFTGRLLVAGPEVVGVPIETFAGRWTIAGEHVLTACWSSAR